jgi:hypothetical protein
VVGVREWSEEVSANVDPTFYTRMEKRRRKPRATPLHAIPAKRRVRHLLHALRNRFPRGGAVRRRTVVVIGFLLWASGTPRPGCFGARCYAAKIGRFTTIDPVYTWRDNLADPQRWNRYACVRNNPLRYVDPDGRVLDTVVDVVFIAYDLFDIGRSVYRGEGVSGAQLAALGGDVAGALLPFATGVGAGIRAGNKAENVIDIAAASNKTENLTSSGGRGSTSLSPRPVKRYPFRRARAGQFP